jgi:hypothetical protein
VGITFRENDSGDYYVALFDTDGDYMVSLSHNDEWKTIRAWESSNAISLEQGNTNSFAILVKDSSFTLYANGQELATVNDTTLNEEGEIGLAVELNADQTVTVDFDNLVVREVPTDETVAEAGATATAEARVTATAKAGAEGILFQDDFSSNANDWWVGEYSDEFGDQTTQVIDGKYRRLFISKRGALDRNNIPGFFAKDFLLSVDATIVEASGRSKVGITFRENDKGDYYVAEFDTDGGYKVSLSHNDEWKTIRDWESSDAISLEQGITNSFAVLVKGSTFTLYANGQELVTVNDTTLSEKGEVGLAISLSADQTLTVDFDNLVIREVPTDETLAEAGARAEGILFQDDFSSNVNDWRVGEFSSEYGEKTDDFVDGRYRRSFVAKKGITDRSTIPDFSAKDFLLSVDATIVEGSGRGSVGITFRENDNDDFYFAEFDTDGDYKVALWHSDEWKIIGHWESSNVISLGQGIRNSFAVLVKDSSFTLYANGQELATVNDTTLSEKGEVGLAISLDADQTLTVDFDNLLIKEAP